MPQRVPSQIELETLGSASRNSAVPPNPSLQQPTPRTRAPERPRGLEKRNGSNLTVHAANLAAERAAQSKYSGHRSGAYGTKEQLEPESRMRRTTR